MWLWHLQGRKRKKRGPGGKRSMARFLPVQGMLVPPCHMGNGEPGVLSKMVLHGGINRKYNPALIAKHTEFQPTKTTRRHLPYWGLGITLQVSDHQDCQSWLHHDVLFLCSDLPWRKQIPNSAEITGSSKALARNCGLIQTHLEEQMTLTWVYQCWWHL